MKMVLALPCLDYLNDGEGSKSEGEASCPFRLREISFAEAALRGSSTKFSESGAPSDMMQIELVKTLAPLVWPPRAVAHADAEVWHAF